MSDTMREREQQDRQNPSATVSSPEPKGHRLHVVDRKEITVTGVREVLSFDSELVRLVTTCGILHLEGRELRVHALNTKDGVVSVTGALCGVLYEELTDGSSRDSAAKPRKTGGFGRLFG